MIQLSHLTKRYGDRIVVDDLSFSAQPGVVTGFRGPNSAGNARSPGAAEYGMEDCEVLSAVDTGQRTLFHIRMREAPAAQRAEGAGMQPTWLLALSWASLAVGVVSFAIVVADTYLRGHRQPVRVMEIVWLVTVLYIGPAAVRLYWNWGRPEAFSRRRQEGQPRRPRRGIVVTHVSRCGAHCALGFIVAEVALYVVRSDPGQESLWVDYAGDYLTAVMIAVLFRYFGAPGRSLTKVWHALSTVVKVELLTITAFEFALFVWLTLAHRVVLPEPPLRPDSPTFWFAGQLGLIAGFIAAWPTASWQLGRGLRFEERRQGRR
ncbi:DUF4396 domain-containing protein [Micromonospora arborensis]|uniref:DUF4396 domain-containing protein n=1 Tax=Micromonospora arborensis TaxID=2116518 RepID=UPI0033C35342